MSDDRKKPLWPWIVALLIGLPVLYVASFGPACWAVARLDHHYPSRAAKCFDAVYWPIGRCAAEEYRFVQPAVYWYAMLGMPKSSQLFLPDDSSGEFGVMLDRE